MELEEILIWAAAELYIIVLIPVEPELALLRVLIMFELILEVAAPFVL